MLNIVKIRKIFILQMRKTLENVYNVIYISKNTLCIEENNQKQSESKKSNNNY